MQKVRMKRSPFSQGHLDGLCGFYAVVNSIKYLAGGRLAREDADELFSGLLSNMAPRRFPRVIWEGTTFGDLRRMCRVAEDFINDNPGAYGSAYCSYPSLRSSPRTINAYWSLLDTWLENHRDGSAIVGLDEPDSHWVVINKTQRTRLEFFDSDGSVYFKNRSSFDLIGKRSRKPYRLNPREMAVWLRD